MKVYETMTGADVLRMRKELRLGRDHLHPLCGFPNSKSAARLSNIELRESWKEGDRERVARALRQVYAERGLPIPELLSDAEYDGPLPEPPVKPTPAASPEPPAAPRPCNHPGGFKQNEAGDWVCEHCGEPSPHNVQAQQAREAMNAGHPVVGGQEVWSNTAEGWVEVQPGDREYVSDDSVVIDATSLDDDEDDWDELLATVVDLSDVEQPDYQMTHSEMRTWLRCRRRWWFAHYRRLASRGRDWTSTRATGDRIHRALQAAYTGDPAKRSDPRDALERAIVEDWTEITQVITNEEQLAVITERFNAANALERAMVEGYVEWLAETGADADYEMAGAEQVLTTRFDVEVDGKSFLVELLGKLDARLRRRTDNAILFVDHKGVGNFTDVVPTLRMNGQMLTYVLLEWANKQGDEVVSGALYNMLRRVKRSSTAKPPFYQRVEVHHNVYEVAAHREHVVGVTTDVLRAKMRLDAGESHQVVTYPTPTTDCRWDCPFFAVCPLFDDGSPGVEDMVNATYEQVDPLERYAGLVPTITARQHEEVK